MGRDLESGQKPAVVGDSAAIAGPGLGFSEQGDAEEPPQRKVAALVKVKFNTIDAAVARVDDMTFPEIGLDLLGIRDQLQMTQAEFAMRFGFSKGAVADWEQGRKRPETTARVLLKVIEKRPDAVREALAAWEPRISILDVYAAPDPSQPNVLVIEINYQVLAPNSRANLVYPFYLE